MNIVCKVVLVVSVIIFLGTFGAVELDSISITQGIIQFIVSGASAYASAYLLNLYTEREDHKIHED
jgi:uncharacterized membrane protein YqhA